MKTAIYARVSTFDQNIDSQLEELRDFAKNRGFQIVEEYVDHGVSGGKDSRPAVDKLLNDARRGKFNVVVVTAFDRFGRSLKFLVDTLEEFRALGIDFISTRQQIDTSTPAGKMTFAVISGMAEFERALISERVRLGMRKAREHGARLGRPKVPEKIVEEILRLRAEGRSYGQILLAVRGKKLRWGKNQEPSRGAIAGIVRRASQKGQQKPALESAKNKESESQNSVCQ